MISSVAKQKADQPNRLDHLRAALEPPSAPLTRKLKKSEGNTNTMVMTSAGLEYLGALARIGANIPTIAERFGVSERWLRVQVQSDEAAATVWRQNKAKDMLDVLLARKFLEATNAQVHIWSSKQKLGESEQAQADVQHTHYVVGMLPDKKQLTHDEWGRMFSPHYESDKLKPD